MAVNRRYTDGWLPADKTFLIGVIIWRDQFGPIWPEGLRKLVANLGANQGTAKEHGVWNSFREPGSRGTSKE